MQASAGNELQFEEVIEVTVVVDSTATPRTSPTPKIKADLECAIILQFLEGSGCIRVPEVVRPSDENWIQFPDDFSRQNMENMISDDLSNGFPDFLERLRTWNDESDSFSMTFRALASKME